MSVFVIAEIGSAWRFGAVGDHLSNARQAIGIAKQSGADCIKFQWTSDPRKMEQRRNVSEGSYDILTWPEKWIRFIATYCEEFEIEFMCTVFLPEDVAILNPYVKRWKVASLERNSTELLKTMEDTGKPIIVSCGASDAKRGVHANLHCTASYPAPPEQLNLSVIEKYGYEGYSDHSCNILTGALTVACGAKIIEVHFKLDSTSDDNPDYAHSLYGKELKRYISAIRQAEVMLGDGIKKIEKCEEWALKHKVKA